MTSSSAFSDKWCNANYERAEAFRPKWWWRRWTWRSRKFLSRNHSAFQDFTGKLFLRSNFSSFSFVLRSVFSFWGIVYLYRPATIGYFIYRRQRRHCRSYCWSILPFISSVRQSNKLWSEYTEITKENINQWYLWWINQYSENLR